MAVHRDDRIGAGFTVDSTDLKLFIRDLRRASPAAAAGLRRVVKTSAEIVAQEARQIAGAHSTSIPPTIKARAYLSGSKRSVASVTAGKGVPLAALYELGNKGKRYSNTGMFRHPVFERSAEGKLQPTSGWVDQPRWAYLVPAAERKGVEIEASLEALTKRVEDILAIRRL